MREGVHGDVEGLGCGGVGDLGHVSLEVSYEFGVEFDFGGGC